MNDNLLITLDGPHIEEGGVPVDCVVTALNGIQDALRLMVEDLGGYSHKGGRRPNWIRNQSRLRLVATRSGSFVAELTLERPPYGQWRNVEYGIQSMSALLRWDGSNDSNFLPKPVTNRLYEIASKMPSDVRLWLGSADNPRKLELKRIRRARRVSSRAEVALLQGRLGEVNWDKRTAQLHNYGGGYVRLRFNAALDEKMRLYGNQYVEVRGLGRFNAKDKWISVEVRELVGTRSGNQPFDLRAFLDDPNPRAFDPNNVVTASEPFDVDEFLRGIYEARDSGRQELSD